MNELVKKEVVSIVKPSLEVKRRALECGLDRYKERLTALERRYGMASENFAAKFNAGELGDDADWFEWQYLLEVLGEIGAMIELQESQP